MDDTKLRVVVCYVGKDSVAGDTKLWTLCVTTKNSVEDESNLGALCVT